MGVLYIASTFHLTKVLDLIHQRFRQNTYMVEDYLLISLKIVAVFVSIWGVSVPDVVN